MMRLALQQLSCSDDVKRFADDCLQVLQGAKIKDRKMFRLAVVGTSYCLLRFFTVVSPLQAAIFGNHAHAYELVCVPMTLTVDG